MKVVSLTTNNDIVEKTTKKEHNALYTRKQPNHIVIGIDIGCRISRFYVISR
jgi:hypothetical protein